LGYIFWDYTHEFLKHQDIVKAIPENILANAKMGVVRFELTQQLHQIYMRPASGFPARLSRVGALPIQCKIKNVKCKIESVTFCTLHF
jgi:hypothetical protein